MAGGVPYKFVSGCWAEGVIAAENAVKYILGEKNDLMANLSSAIKGEVERVFAPFFREDGVKSVEMEERLQKIMDEYAGGVSRYYEMNEHELFLALNKICHLKTQIKYLVADDLHELMNCHEVIDRIDIAEVLIHHLLYRKETRWPAYQSRVDYPNRNDRDWLKFINSRVRNNKVEIMERPYQQLVSGDRYIPY